MKLLNEIHTQIVRIRENANPDAAVAVENGLFTYQSVVPLPNGQYQITDHFTVGADEIIDALIEVEADYYHLMNRG